MLITQHDVIKNWLRSRDTVEFLKLWESLHNPDFKPVDFDGFRNEAGANAFTMSPQKWIKGVNAIKRTFSNYRRVSFLLTDVIKEMTIYFITEWEMNQCV